MRKYNIFKALDYYFDQDGSFISGKLFMELVSEICKNDKYKDAELHCFNGNFINRIVMKENSRTLYLSKTDIILFGSKYSLRFSAYRKYLSFFTDLDHDVILTTDEFLRRLELYMKV